MKPRKTRSPAGTIVGVQLPPDLLQPLDQETKDRRVSRSDILREMLMDRYKRRRTTAVGA